MGRQGRLGENSPLRALDAALMRRVLGATHAAAALGAAFQRWRAAAAHDARSVELSPAAFAAAFDTLHVLQPAAGPASGAIAAPAAAGVAAAPHTVLITKGRWLRACPRAPRGATAGGSWPGPSWLSNPSLELHAPAGAVLTMRLTVRPPRAPSGAAAKGPPQDDDELGSRLAAGLAVLPRAALAARGGAGVSFSDFLHVPTEFRPWDGRAVAVVEVKVRSHESPVRSPLPDGTRCPFWGRGRCQKMSLGLRESACVP